MDQRRGGSGRDLLIQNRGMELGAIIEALYESEINCSVSTLWDAHITVQLDDEMNGFVAEKECNTASEAAEFLDRAAGEVS